MLDWQRKVLSPKEQLKIEEKVGLFEKELGIQLVIVILRYSDPYPAATLRFSLVSTFLLSLVFSLFIHIPDPAYYIIVLLPFFLVSTVLSRLTVFKNMFLSKKEIIREVSEKASELFYSMGINETPERVGALLLISIKEKETRIILDKKLMTKITTDDVDRLTSSIKLDLKHSNFYVGLNQALDNIKEKFKHFFPGGCSSSNDGELSYKIIWNDFS